MYKILRDMRGNWLAFAASTLMVATATMLFVGFLSADLNLQQSCNFTYNQLHFLDFYLPLRAAPLSVVNSVRDISGVEAAVGRRVASVRIVPPATEPDAVLNGTVIGMPVDRRPAVNDVFVEKGAYLSCLRGQVLVEKRFAVAHGYQVGDRIQVQKDEARYAFTVVGLVSSPEFIWLVKDRYDPRPAAKRLGVLFLSEQDAELIAGEYGINEIHARVREGQDPDAIMAVAQRRVAEYLSSPPVSRQDQPSNALLERDRRSFASVALLFPVVFLGLSTLILLGALWQLISQQRRQIGVLLAQGLSPWQVAGHFIGASMLVGGGGAVLGATLGMVLGELCTRFYIASLGIPFVVTRVHWACLLTAVGAAVAVSLLAGGCATFRFASLNVIELLRNDFIPCQRAPRLERWFPYLGKAGFLLRLPLRNLLRQPIRSCVVVAGITFSVMVVVMTMSFLDSAQADVDFLFNKVHTYTLQVNLRRGMSPGAVPAVQYWPGVVRVEACLREPATISFQSKQVVRGVWGIPPGAQLMRLYDSTGHILDNSTPDSVFLAPLHLRQLAAAPGNVVRLQLDLVEPHPPAVSCSIGPELFEPVATPPKMSLRTLQRLVAASSHSASDVVNVLLVKVAADQQESVRQRLSGDAAVEEVVNLADMRGDVDELLHMARAYFMVMFVFSSLLAFILLVGSTTLNVMERLRELATMAILGFADSTLAGLLVVETLCMWLMGLVLGIPGGMYLGNWLLNHYQSDLLQMNLTLRPQTILGTAFATLLICLLALGPALRSILRTRLASVVSSPG